MSDEAQSSFDIGKKLFEQENFGETVSAFAKAVRLNPENAEYRMWFSFALVNDKDYQKAIEQASKAIELDPNLSAAYRCRAWAYFDTKNFDEALKDITTAIELDPKNVKNINARRSIYYDRGDWHNYIYDSMRYCELKGEIDLYKPETAEDSDSRFGLESVNKHFTSVVYPQIKSNGEKVVDYWVGIIVWGRESKQQMFEGSTYTREHGTIGYGYICLTDQNLRVVSLQVLSYKLKKGLKESKSGFLRILADSLRRSSDDTKASTKDEFWTIPNRTIQGAQSVTDSIISNDPLVSIVTAVLTWYFYTVDVPMIVTAINMAAIGKLSEVFSTSAPPSKVTQAEVISLLKELGELKEKGIITESEFNEKKKELLSRL